MPPNPNLRQGLKLLTLMLLGMVGTIVVMSVAKPTNGSVLTGRLLTAQQRGETPTIHIDAARAAQGFSVPTETHVIFVVPNGVRIPRIAFFGGSDIDQKIRYWGYCFSGNEQQNKANGLTGKAVYDGQFFFSLAEREAETLTAKPNDNDLVGILGASTQTHPAARPSIAEIFYGGQTCYVTVDEVSAVAAGFGGGLPGGLDDDGDDLNNMREVALGTDPHSPDTDRDGLADGIEVMKEHTNPRDPDTDRDALLDGCEDKNHSGTLDQGETSPIVADSDRDGLCDGNGFGSGCPEPKQSVCSTDQSGDRQCRMQPSSPVFGEDMNGNCSVDEGETDPTKSETFGMPDWDYKWKEFQTKTGVRPDGNGTPAPEFPIPAVPVDN